MSEPFLGEIRPVAFNFAPRGWAFCDGQILPINQNQSLYSLLGTTFGGDGSTSFALPDLRGRVPMHEDGVPGLRLGDRVGAATLASAGLQQLSTFRVDRGLATSLGESNVASGTDALPNETPAYLAVNFCIALQGLFPSRN
jgi:microcystin-dependent protein